MINWKNVKNNTPTSVNKHYDGSPETPYVSCLVWVCNINAIVGGIALTVRWDTENKCWLKIDMNHAVFQESHLSITHFCDDINAPTND